MSKKKANKFLTVFTIFFKSIKLYFMYLDKTAKHLFIPVFGQILGMFFIFLTVYYFNTNINSIMKINYFSENNGHLILGLLAVVLPSLVLFLYSFYRYIIAFCSLNIAAYTLFSSKKTKDIDLIANDAAIERRLFQYILLMFLVSVLCIFLPLWLPLCLVFQIFALENDTNCLKAISGSIKLTMENMFYVIIMLVLVFLATYWFLPELFIWALEKASIVDLFITRLELYLQILPYDEWNDILSIIGANIDSVTIAKFMVNTSLSFVIIGFTLPLRCSCFTGLYRLFDNEHIKEISKTDEEIIKRANQKRRKKS